MEVRELMHPQVVIASSDTPLPKIWSLIFKKHVHDLPIVDPKTKKLVGIIAKEDFLLKLFPNMEELSEISLDDDGEIVEKLDKLKKQTAEKVMNTRVYFTRPDSHVMRALSRMIIRKVRQLPVIDDDDQLVGMISKGDIFKGIFKRKRFRK